MIGVDIVKIERIDRFLDRYKHKALRRILTKSERRLAKTAQTVAGFYAAKEAFSKALGVGISRHLGFMDMKIYKDKRGAPHLKLSKKVIKKFSIKNTSLSITHDGDYAIAVVIVEKF